MCRSRLQFIGLAMLGSFFATAAGADQFSDPNEWRPDSSLVAEIDKKAIDVTIPAEFGPVSQYSRYYWGTVENGRRVVEGILVTNKYGPIAETAKKVDAKSLTIDGTSGLAHLVAEKDAPAFADGGCMFIFVVFDVGDNKMTSERCNFDLPPPPPPH